MVLTIDINSPPPYLTLNRNEHLPVVMSVATSDSSGGAGVEADIKTITAHKCYAMTCVVGLTAQTPSKVYSMHSVPKDFILRVLDSNLNDMRCDAIKTGALTKDAVDALSSKLKNLGEKRPQLVVDPVLVATSGSSFNSEGLVEAIKAKLTPLATLVTPNLFECFELLGSQVEIKNIEDVYELAKKVSAVTGAPNVLVKGGHISWDDDNKKLITDVLYLSKESKFVLYKGPRLNTTHTHGTGCTLASAIASNLARGYPLPQAVYGGIEYVQNGVAIGCSVCQPHIDKNGPINHVYAIEVPLETMVQDECFTAHEVVPKAPAHTIYDVVGSSLFEYLISHPKVKPHWESYVHHEFVKQIAQGTLKREKFQFFIEQDYAYLLDYARVHCVAGSKAPSLDDVEKELVIVGSVRKEMAQHEMRLKQEFGVVSDSYFDEIQRSPALKAYSRYFNDVAKRGNWQELVSSLSPCLMGYGHALLNFRDQIEVEEGTVYREWCDTYLAEWYHDAMREGESLLDQIARTYPADQLETLVAIYADVCALETEFWTSALRYGQ